MYINYNNLLSISGNIAIFIKYPVKKKKKDESRSCVKGNCLNIGILKPLGSLLWSEKTRQSERQLNRQTEIYSARKETLYHLKVTSKVLFCSKTIEAETPDQVDFVILDLGVIFFKAV